MVTSAHVKSLAENVRLLARYAMQEIGAHVRAAPLPRRALRDVPAVDAVVPLGDAIFCTFCREQIEAKVRSLKS